MQFRAPDSPSYPHKNQAECGCAGQTGDRPSERPRGAMRHELVRNPRADRGSAYRGQERAQR